MAYSSEQRKNISRSRRVARRKGATPREEKALLLAEAVESGYRNLNYGDRDSQGILQQRPSQGWGAPGDVDADVAQFLERAQALNRKGFKGSAGQLAQAVQRSAFPGRYDQHSKEVDRLLHSGSPGSSPSSTGSSSTSASYRPGVDNSQQRQQAMLSYIDQRNNPNALLELKAALDASQDTPGKYTYSSTPKSGGGSHGVIRKGKSPLLELFWQGAGGIDVKNGKKVPQGFVEGHRDHVHVAAGPKTVVALGQLAKKMGLHVGENPHYGGVNPVHVKGSYHYRGEAIDVSGDPGKMRAYAHAVARLYGLA